MKHTRDYAKDSKFDITSFKSALETELAKMGLVNGKVVSIENFAEMLSNSQHHCKVTVEFENTDSRVKLRVHKQGKKLTFTREEC